MLTHLSLFTGIGGLDLAGEMAGFTTAGQCEFADFPYRVLCKHWPSVYKWRDIQTLTGDDFYKQTGLQTVNVLSAGFPCQPHSLCGHRKASDDERDLWPETFRTICEIKPRWFIGENVSGLLSSEDGRFFGGILRDLAMGGIALDGYVYPLMPSEPHFGVSELRLWPRPIASDGIAWTKINHSDLKMSIWKVMCGKHQDRPIYHFAWNGLSANQSAEYTGMMMGFPPHWTDLNPTEMQ